MVSMLSRRTGPLAYLSWLECSLTDRSRSERWSSCLLPDTCAYLRLQVMVKQRPPGLRRIPSGGREKTERLGQWQDSLLSISARAPPTASRNSPTLQPQPCEASLKSGRRRTERKDWY